MILVLNSGSSSIKFGVFDGSGERPAPLFRGAIEHIGDRPGLRAREASGATVLERSWDSPQSEEDLIGAILGWLDGETRARELTAVGHRIVHGGSEFVRPTLLTERSVAAIARLTPLAPLHQERCLSPVRSLMKLRPDLQQIGCFDTAFHATLRPPASRFPVPRRYEREGIRRYGFHGLSFEYIARELERRSPGSSGQATVIAHLGNGASLCALRDGRSLDTTMGLTPLDGLMMGTRSGTIDPGLVLYLQRERGMSTADVEHMLYHDAGLLGVSGISSDMQKLLGSDRPEAKEAIDLFTFIAAKDIAAMACSLEGFDRLVFTGGIGEHGTKVRDMICARLAWLGIDLDDAANGATDDVVSTQNSRVEVRVVPTNEEAMIAEHVHAATRSGDGSIRNDGSF
jgi:acetate kinase